jgi:hypothetical protein
VRRSAGRREIDMLPPRQTGVSRCHSVSGNRRYGMASLANEEAKRRGDAFEERPHAFDPALSPELFEGVLARRVIAFAIDVIVIGCRSCWPPFSSFCSRL